MLDLFHIAKPQGCDIQTFYGNEGVGTAATQAYRAWNKPRGVSHVYMMLIGGGADGDGGTGGGSGAVTVWYGAAQHVPDSLVVSPGRRGQSSTVSARFSNSGSLPTALLTANQAAADIGGTASTANQFAATGFFRSTAGQNGSGGGQAASATTFLSGGGSLSGGIISNYGYDNTASSFLGRSANGFFQLQPIIVGGGGSGDKNAGIGCGGGVSSGLGGAGFVLIASW